MVEAIKSGKYPFVMCNFAPPDMVGHTGVYEAAVVACAATGEAIYMTLKSSLTRYYYNITILNFVQIRLLVRYNKPVSSVAMLWWWLLTMAMQREWSMKMGSQLPNTLLSEVMLPPLFSFSGKLWGSMCVHEIVKRWSILEGWFNIQCTWMY